MGCCCSSAKKEQQPDEEMNKSQPPVLAPLLQENIEVVKADPIPSEIEVDAANKEMADHGSIDPNKTLCPSKKERDDGTQEWTTYISVPDDQHTMAQLLTLNGISGKVTADIFDEVCESNGYQNTIGKFGDYFPLSRGKSDGSVHVTSNRVLNSIISSKSVKLQISDTFPDVGTDRRIIKITGSREKDIYAAVDLYISTLSRDSQKLVKTTGHCNQSMEENYFSKHSSYSCAKNNQALMSQEYVRDPIYKKPGFTTEEHKEYVLFYPKDDNPSTDGDYLYSSKLKCLGKSNVKPEHKGIINYKGKTYNVVSILGDDEDAILIGRGAFDNDHHRLLKGCLFDYKYQGDRNVAMSKSMNSQISVNNSTSLPESIASVLLDELMNESFVQKKFGRPFGGATLMCKNSSKRDVHLLGLPYCAQKVDAILNSNYCTGRIVSKFRKDEQIINVLRMWGKLEKINLAMVELRNSVQVMADQPVRTTVLGS